MVLETRPNPFEQGAVDILMMVGEEHYTVESFVNEAKEWGVSKKINPKSIPEGIVPLVSRIFCWHPKALPMVTAEGKTMKDLTMVVRENSPERDEWWDQEYTDLFEEWTPEEFLLPVDYVPAHILKVTYFLQSLEGKDYNKLEAEFGIVWQGGVIGFSHLGFIQYVCKKGEDDVPDDLKHIGNIMPVRIKYVGEEEEEWEQ